MEPILKLEKLSKSFGDLEVLKGIDLSVHKDETIVLIGSSGSGKSTLLRCINFMEIPTGGRIFINGQLQGTERTSPSGDTQMVCSESRLCEIRIQVGMVFQQFNLFPHMTVVANVMEGPLTVLKQPKKAAREKALTYLTKVGLVEKTDAYPAQLSGGQQQRVAIARALAMEPEIMLFDEVTSALDPELVGEVLLTMQELRREGMTMLIVTHELGFAYAVADRILFLHNGHILVSGTPQEVLLQPKEERVKAFLSGHNQFQIPQHS
jgi:polar amino acid transport system ATP-binding protein